MPSKEAFVFYISMMQMMILSKIEHYCEIKKLNMFKYKVHSCKNKFHRIISFALLRAKKESV